MSRDHYKGVPKKRAALFNSDGELEALEKGGDIQIVDGTATLPWWGDVTITGSHFTAASYAFVSAKHPYPTTEGLSWFVGDGYLTISGATGSSYTLAYTVKIV